jgi:hypothetical protein
MEHIRKQLRAKEGSSSTHVNLIKIISDMYIIKWEIPGTPDMIFCYMSNKLFEA